MRPAFAIGLSRAPSARPSSALGLVAYARALEGKGRRAFVITGGFLGLAFLRPAPRARGPARRRHGV